MASTIEVQPSGQACGAIIRGIDFSSDLDAEDIEQVRRVWMEHHVGSPVV